MLCRVTRLAFLRKPSHAAISALASRSLSVTFIYLYYHVNMSLIVKNNQSDAIIRGRFFAHHESIH